MIIHDVKQGTHEWDKLRGIPTASNDKAFMDAEGRLKTRRGSGGLRLAEGGETYLRKLIRKSVFGSLEEERYANAAMDYGSKTESEARAWFDLTYGDSHGVTDLREVGFITTSDKLLGLSPDGIFEIAGEKWGLEIKCPSSLDVHLGYWLESMSTGDVPNAHKPQVYGSLARTGFDGWVFMSYFDNPKIANKVVWVRAEDHEGYLEGVRETLYDFSNRFETFKKEIAG